MAVGALLSNAFGFMPAPSQWGGVHSLRKGVEGSTQSWKAGAPLLRSSGKLIVATNGAVADFVGVACAAATGTADSEVLYYPCQPGAVFEATLEDQSLVSHALVITDVYTDYGIYVDSGGIWYVNFNETTNTAVTVVGLRKWQDVTDATVRARVLVSFLHDVTIYNT